MNRFKAAFIHLLISAAIMASVLSVAFLIWYPWGSFELMGAWPPTVTMLLVDLVVGPVLTLILFKTDLRLWRIDLTLIVVIQLIALVYGVRTLHEGRPQVIAAGEARFHVVRPVDMVDPSWNPVRWEDGRLFARPEVVFSTNDGLQHHLRPQTYEPIEDFLVILEQRALSMAAVLQNDETSAALRAMLDGTGLNPDDVFVFPLRAVLNFGTLVLDRRTGAFVALSELEFEEILRNAHSGA